MKRIVPFLSVVFLLFGLKLFADESAERLLLSTNAREMIKSSKAIVATELSPMIKSPIFMPHKASGGRQKQLSDPQREVLLSHLLHSKELESRERFKNCKFKPGIMFSFYPEPLPDGSADFWAQGDALYDGMSPLVDRPEAPMSLLLCLNCNVWALPTGAYLTRQTNQPDPQRIGFFGDSQSGVKELSDLFLELFPKSLSGVR